MVPLLIRVLRIPPHLAVGASLATIFLIVSTGFLTYISTVTIPVPLALVLVIGALIGSLFGAGMTDFFSERNLKRLLFTLYIFTLASIVLELFHQSKIGIAILGAYVTALIILFIYKYRMKKKRLFSIE